MVLTIIVFAITLLILVISHELGHFLVAKKFGVKVLEFGFGLPPKLFSKRYGETKYSINALPIGGFVQLLGEDETDKELLKNPRSFSSKPTWQRILIVGAGVFINLIFAWILFYIVLFNQNWRIIYPTLEPTVVVADVQDNFPAKAAGIQVGERILKIDGTPFTELEDTIRYIRARANQPIKLTLGDIDGNNPRELELTPKEVNPGDGRIGVAFSPIPFKQYKTTTERIFSAPSYSWDLTKLTFQGFGKLFFDLGKGNYKSASQSVSGPVGLVQATNGFVSSGWQATLPYLWFVGVISLTLSIFNSLPFPALDGGRIFFMLIELVTGKRVNQNFERIVHSVGMIILLTLMVLITISDISKLNFITQIFK